MKRLFITAAAVAVLAVGFFGCGDDNGVDPIDPVITDTKTYLKKGDKVLYEDTVWIQWTAAISGTGAVVEMSSRKPNDSAWCNLPVVERLDKSARVVVRNASLNFENLSPFHTAKIRIYQGAAEEILDSVFLKAVILKPLAKSRGGDTVSTGDTVTLTWRVNANLVNSLLFNLSPDNGNTWTEILSGQGTPITDASFRWIVGGEDNPQTFSASDPVLLKMSDYDNKYFDQKNLIYKP